MIGGKRIRKVVDRNEKRQKLLESNDQSDDQSGNLYHQSKDRPGTDMSPQKVEVLQEDIP